MLTFSVRYLVIANLDTYITNSSKAVVKIYEGVKLFLVLVSLCSILWQLDTNIASEMRLNYYRE